VWVVKVGEGLREFEKEAYLVYRRRVYNEIREILLVSSYSLQRLDIPAGGDMEMVNQRYNRIIVRTQ